MTKRDSNVIKGVAIMLMLWHHLFMYADAPLSLPLISILSPAMLAFTGKMGKACVSLFVFVTAYGTAQQYLKDDMKDTRQLVSRSISRYIKLLVSYQLVYIISFVLCPLGGASPLTLYDPSVPKSLLYTAVDFMGLSNILGTPTYCPTWWYMSIAFTLILLLPWMIKLCRRTGAFILLPVFFVLRWLGPRVEFETYIPIAFMGVLASQYGLVEKLEQSMKGRHLGKLLLWALCLFALAVGTKIKYYGPLVLFQVSEYVMLISALILILGIPNKIPGLNSVLAFLGKCSMNIFLFHTFIFQIWFSEFTYSLKYPLLMLSFLLLSSLLFSVLLEALKKPLHIPQLIDWLSGKANALLLPRERA